MRWTDGKTDYGWISIALHWLSAALILALLFIGNSIRSPAGLHAPMLKLHTTLALGTYALLWLRIGWRLRSGHPGPLPRQKPFSHTTGRWFHYLLTAALAVMLLSGPLMAWGGDVPLYLGDWRLPAPPLRSDALFAAGWRVHVAAATVLGWGALIHALAVMKHVAFDRDGTLDKILTPLGPPP